MTNTNKSGIFQALKEAPQKNYQLHFRGSFKNFFSTRR